MGLARESRNRAGGYAGGADDAGLVQRSHPLRAVAVVPDPAEPLGRFGKFGRRSIRRRQRLGIDPAGRRHRADPGGAERPAGTDAHPGELHHDHAVPRRVRAQRRPQRPGGGRAVRVRLGRHDDDYRGGHRDRAVHARADSSQARSSAQGARRTSRAGGDQHDRARDLLRPRSERTRRERDGKHRSRLRGLGRLAARRNTYMALMHARIRLAASVGLALALSACTVHKTEVPALSGPSGLGNNISITVSPDVLTQDGVSQSLVTITALDSNGQPKPSVRLRADIAVAGSITDFGRLSAKSLVTDSTGKATVTFTAPPPPAVVVNGGTKV